MNKEFTEDEIIDDSNKDIPDAEITDDSEPHTLSGPIKFILGLFLVIILISWLVPHYYIKDNPHPKYIPEISEVYIPRDINRSVPPIDSHDKYRLYVNPRDSEIIAVANRIASKSCDYSGNYIVCHSKAIFYFVRDKFDYVKDPAAFEYVKLPLESLNNLGGDCDDASVLLASLLGSIGIKIRLVFVPKHVYVEAYLPEASSKYKAYRKQDWVALDATCKNCEFGEVSIKTATAEKSYLEVT